MNSIWLIIFGMMMVTYIPRVVPFLLTSERSLPTRVKLFLDLIPYCALGALILPDGLTALTDKPFLSVICLLAAAVYSYWRGNVVVTVVGCICLAYLLLLI